ncbi:MAG: PilZ domain-containing protein [Terriglobia bacterium]
MPGDDERRKAQRFPLELPLEVKWQGEAAEVQKPARIRDISANGIYFLVDRNPQPESKIEFYVRLPMEGAPEQGVLLHCVGSIVRIESSQGKAQRVGVGARIDRYRFVRPGEAPGDIGSEEPKP